MKKLLLSILLLFLAWNVHAKENNNASDQEGEEVQGRVQYALILPDEKTPEVVKTEENSPFQPSSSGNKKAEENTEENQVREILLKLPAVGGVSGPSGMRVMLGGMRLVEGGMVPQVLPDQQVALKVKSITSSAIELSWIEKKPTGLPPKVLTIPLDGAPKVRYRLPANGSTSAAGGQAPASAMGSLRRNGVAVLVSPSESGREPPRLPPQIATPLVAGGSDMQARSGLSSPLLPPLIETPLVSEAEEAKAGNRMPPPLPPLIATPLVSEAKGGKAGSRMPPPLPPLIATPLVSSADDKVEVRKAMPFSLPPQVTAPVVASVDKVEVRRATPASVTPQVTAPVVASVDKVEVRKATPAAPPQDTAPMVANADKIEAPKITPAAPPPHIAMPLVVSADEPEVLDSVPPPNPLPRPADVPEASVMRMLFGNHAPAGK